MIGIRRQAHTASIRPWGSTFTFTRFQPNFYIPSSKKITIFNLHVMQKLISLRAFSRSVCTFREVENIGASKDILYSALLVNLTNIALITYKFPASHVTFLFSLDIRVRSWCFLDLRFETCTWHHDEVGCCNRPFTAWMVVHRRTVFRSKPVLKHHAATIIFIHWFRIWQNLFGQYIFL